jgi:hypothetical protein
MKSEGWLQQNQKVDYWFFTMKMGVKEEAICRKQKSGGCSTLVKVK